MSFPDSSVGIESACDAGDPRSIPGVGRYPGEGIGYPLQYSGLENAMDRIVYGVAKSWTQLSDFCFHFFKEDRRLNFKLLAFCDVLAFYFFIGL